MPEIAADARRLVADGTAVSERITVGTRHEQLSLEEIAGLLPGMTEVMASASRRFARRPGPPYAYPENAQAAGNLGKRRRGVWLLSESEE